MTIRNNLFEFWKQKEIELGRVITITEVSKATGANRDTISRAKSGEVWPDKDTVEILCQFFNAPPGPVPFLIYEPDDK